MTSSKLHSSLLQFEEKNQVLSQKTEDFISLICQSDDLHARFLNTLSCMEYIGSRKIMLSLPGRELNSLLLQHINEETRHAYFFKRLAERIAGKSLTYKDHEMILPAAARRYIPRLEAHIKRSLPQHESLIYHYTTLVVELRALWFYKRYHATLKENKSHISLHGILAEEDQHLTEMLDALNNIEDASMKLADFINYEVHLYQCILSTMRKNVVQSKVSICA